MTRNRRSRPSPDDRELRLWKVGRALSVTVVVAILAVHLAGGAYVPMAPDYPAERLAFLEADAAVAFTRTEADAAPFVGAAGKPAAAAPAGGT